jgi:hypothetical protein
MAHVRTGKGESLRVPSPKGRHALCSIAALTCLLTLTQAQAQEYCVACSEPPGLYRCIIEGAKPGGALSLQMFCVTAMAKQGRHAKCAVKGGTVFDCDGQVKRVPWSAQSEAPLAPVQKAGKPPADPKQPPQTVEEIARRAKDQTAEQIQNANAKAKEKVRTLGDNIGDATKKTWRCVTSLFTRCSE